MKLVINAEYLDISDVVAVAIYYGDAATLYPEKVESGTVKLYFNNAPISVAEFSKYTGNSDGSFRISFLHPTTTRSLSVGVNIVTTDEEEISKIVAVRTVNQNMENLFSNQVVDEEEESELQESDLSYDI